MAQKTGLVALEAASAEITTASVTIRTLRVNSRQLTMGTFRQLPVGDFIEDETLEVTGLIWGWVNYDVEPGNRNFVVQFGEELRRCEFKIRNMTRNNVDKWPWGAEGDAIAFEREAAGYVLASAILGEPGGLEFYNGESWQINLAKNRPFFGKHSIKIGYYKTFDPPDSAVIHDSLYPRKTYSSGGDLPDETIKRDMHYSRQQVMDIMKKKHPLHAGENLAYWDAQLDRIDREVAEYAGRWNALMDRLRSVKQLFIAT